MLLGRIFRFLNRSPWESSLELVKASNVPFLITHCQMLYFSQDYFSEFMLTFYIGGWLGFWGLNWVFLGWGFSWWEFGACGVGPIRFFGVRALHIRMVPGDRLRRFIAGCQSRPWLESIWRQWIENKQLNTPIKLLDTVDLVINEMNFLMKFISLTIPTTKPPITIKIQYLYWCLFLYNLSRQAHFFTSHYCKPGNLGDLLLH